ncbi:hypothetical protein LLG95_08275 [bacterium]|nr:hypothetical protein [bacterium]
MFTPDRTIKLMLGAIILLLAALLADRLISTTATAQSSTTTSSGLVELAWKTDLVTNLKLGSSDRVKNILALDQANSVVVQYEDRIEIYRLAPVYVNPDNITIKKTTSSVQPVEEIKR